MQTKQKDKMISVDEAKNKSEQSLEEFHFGGGGEYQPITVRAASREEAEAIWTRERTKVEPSQIINQ